MIHNALQAFLQVKQEPSESISAFISRAREALRLLQSTRPPSAPLAAVLGSGATYSLEDSDRELLISVLLGGTKYSALTTSLLAQSELTVQQVEDALKNEEAHRLGAAVAAAAASSSGSGIAAPASVSSVAHSVPNPDTLLSAASSTRTTASVQRKRSRSPLKTRRGRRKIALAKPMLPRMFDWQGEPSL